MGSNRLSLLGIITLVGAFLGVYNASNLSNGYEVCGELPPCLHPPLNIAAGVWVILSLFGAALGLMFFVAGYEVSVRKMTTWIFGLSVYAHW